MVFYIVYVYVVIVVNLVDCVISFFGFSFLINFGVFDNVSVFIFEVLSVMLMKVLWVVLGILNGVIFKYEVRYNFRGV